MRHEGGFLQECSGSIDSWSRKQISSFAFVQSSWESYPATRYHADTILPTCQSYPKKRKQKRINSSKGIPLPNEIGVTKESLLKADKEERLRVIYRMSDEIRVLNFNMESAAANFRSHHHHHSKNNKSQEFQNHQMERH